MWILIGLGIVFATIYTLAAGMTLQRNTGKELSPDEAAQALLALATALWIVVTIVVLVAK
jgi:hypothetical protein